MIEICVNCPDVLEINSIHVGEIYAPEGYVSAALLVLEKITLRDYLNFVNEHNLIHRVNSRVTEMNFYRVRLLD